MKRDWTIIRSILLALEEAETPNAVLNSSGLPQFPEQEVAYNMRLLKEGKFINASISDMMTGTGHIGAAFARSMTNTGHELLDTIRSETVWSRIQDKFKSGGVEMTFDLVLTVGKKIMESMLP